ncbi:MAG: hypothetical protein GY797_18745 [Deltaproteobacteria bacterium]|nr:hypothetical protein [Deltaproteobacteria bacterium]
MEVPVELNNKIVEFLKSLPNIHDSNSQRALLLIAGLDTELQDQIYFSGPPAQFFQLLIPTLLSYGKLKDGRNAVEAVLEAAKNSVGQDKKDYCDMLIQDLQSFRSGQNHNNDLKNSATQFQSPTTESLDTTILRIVYLYYQKHPGDPEMSVDELLQEIPEDQTDAVQTELFSLKKKSWIGYDLTTGGTAGLVWIEPKGIKIAKQLS